MCWGRHTLTHKAAHMRHSALDAQLTKPKPTRDVIKKRPSMMKATRGPTRAGVVQNAAVA